MQKWIYPYLYLKIYRALFQLSIIIFKNIFYLKIYHNNIFYFKNFNINISK